jgi:AmiR/NasT family two-component response regulator
MSIGRGLYQIYLREFKRSEVGTRLGMRDIIGRAEMMLRRRYGLDATDAYALLVKVSEQQNRSLNSVALEVIERLPSGISADLAERGP